MFNNLKDFLKTLDKAGELKYIKQQVSPHLEISKFTDKESKSPNGGKALFFTNVQGSSFPVATNIFGSSRRICLALGVSRLDQLAERMKKYIDFSPPTGFKDALNAVSMAISVAKFFPRSFAKSKTPPCQEVIFKRDEVDLSKLPILHCWPKDAGRFITLPIVFTKSLVTGKRNVGMYRMQVFDKNSTGMHWHIHKDGSHYYREYASKGKRMPVAVAIGADPAVIYAATAPMPRGVDEMLLAGFIRKKPVMMAKCVTIDMQIPAEAEFVLEGYVEPEEFRIEGPFGDHTGYYSPADNYPVFHVTALTHRKNPVYNATLVGPPPMEDCYMAKATERLFLPMLQTVMPEICDYWFPWEGVFHNIVIVSIDKEYEGHAQKIMHGLWGQGQMSFCKAIVVVDKNIDPKNSKQVIKTFLEKFDASSDITITKGVLDVLDHSSPFTNFGNKIGIDLTDRIAREPLRNIQSYATKTLPNDAKILDTLQNNSSEFIDCRRLFSKLSENKKLPNRIIALSVEKTNFKRGKDFASILLDMVELNMFNVFIMFDRNINLSNNSLMLWKLFNNVDPERDIIFNNNRLVIDAGKKEFADGHKRHWPEELTF